MKERNIAIYKKNGLKKLYEELINEWTNRHILEIMIALTEKLDFTFDDVYKAYKKKNAINYERLNNGY